MRKSFAGIFLLMALCLTSTAQRDRDKDKDDTEKSGRLLSLENAWNEAEARHDANALRLLTVDTFSYTDSDGKYLNRDQWLAQIAAEKSEYEQLTNNKMEVHVYLGSIAIVTGEYREKSRVRQKSVSLSGRFTDTWIQQNHEWRCVASQETLITR